jgi:hypothetical protein
LLPKRPAEFIASANGELGLVEHGRARRTVYEQQEKVRWHSMLAGVAAERGYKFGWVAYKYREKFGHWPPSNSVAPMPASPEVLSWVRSRNIAFAKRRAVA